ncbi:MAG: hypothetical protein U0794_16850 [Isosphaeraceae bacterium]
MSFHRPRRFRAVGPRSTGNAPGEVRVWPGTWPPDTVAELETRSSRLAFRGFEVTVGGTRLDDAFARDAP